MKKHVYKVGDLVEIVNPRFIRRVGYPMYIKDTKRDILRNSDFSTIMSKFVDFMTCQYINPKDNLEEEFSRFLLCNDLEKKHELVTYFNSKTRGDTVEQVANAIARNICRQKSFGGHDRSIHYHDEDAISSFMSRVGDDKLVGRIQRKRIVKTGTRDWDSEYGAFFCEDKTHVLLQVCLMKKSHINHYYNNSSYYDFQACDTDNEFKTHIGNLGYIYDSCPMTDETDWTSTMKSHPDYSYIHSIVVIEETDIKPYVSDLQRFVNNLTDPELLATFLKKFDTKENYERFSKSISRKNFKEILKQCCWFFDEADILHDRVEYINGQEREYSRDDMDIMNDIQFAYRTLQFAFRISRETPNKGIFIKVVCNNEYENSKDTWKIQELKAIPVNFRNYPRIDYKPVKVEFNDDGDIYSGSYSMENWMDKSILARKYLQKEYVDCDYHDLRYLKLLT